MKQKQLELCRCGWERGYRDHFIAKAIGIPYREVFDARIAEGLTKEVVQERRYAWWEKLIRQGVSVTKIASMYEVSEQTIRLAMWRQRKFSFEQSNKRLLQAVHAMSDSLFDSNNEGRSPLEWELV